MSTEPTYKTTIRRSRGSVTFDIIVHPSRAARAVVINLPGFRGDINGFNAKYRSIARLLVERGVGAVIQMPNIERDRNIYFSELIEDLRAVCNFALASSVEFCGTPHPDFYLIGTSMGGAAVAAVASEYAWVKKVLLVAPAGADDPFVQNAFRRFQGDVSVIIGDSDHAVGDDVCKKYMEMAESARTKKSQIIEHCDHHFQGTPNGQILSKAPFWAFAGDETFPSPKGGAVLY